LLNAPAPRRRTSAATNWTKLAAIARDAVAGRDGRAAGAFTYFTRNEGGIDETR
jgi:hypothetical protein